MRRCWTSCSPRGLCVLGGSALCMELLSKQMSRASNDELTSVAGHATAVITTSLRTALNTPHD
ncbi:hypothetical protein GJAV_G00252530 [Gymnothorax javanicus]|nr:hypothetical protein GJAV_G00252530 [Gymnothorax javanicus]